MILDRVLNFLFPSKCRICKKRGKFDVCEKCIRQIERYEDLHIINFQNRYLDTLIYFFKYKDYIRKLILDYKFFNKFYIGKVFSKIILKNEKICRNLKLYDIIIPVPMHKIKKRERGYNQTEILAQDLAKNLKLEYSENILIKTINNKKQSSLSRKERYENIKNVFKIVKSDKIKDKKILLIDDICTTSATLEECAKVLKHAGVSMVVALVIAKD